jgi:phage-related protein
MSKVWTWIKVNGASILGIIQACIKALKEVLTAIVNLISIFLPTVGSQKVVLWIRNALETVDGWIEKVKPNLIPPVE